MSTCGPTARPRAFVDGHNVLEAGSGLPIVHRTNALASCLSVWHSGPGIAIRLVGHGSRNEATMTEYRENIERARFALVLAEFLQLCTALRGNQEDASRFI